MSFLVVVLVAVCVFLYVKTTRSARQQWLVRLDLQGAWHWQEGDFELHLLGSLQSGEYRAKEGAWSGGGHWQLVGHRIQFTPRSAEAANAELKRSAQGGTGDAKDADREKPTVQSPAFLDGDKNGGELIFEVHFFKPGTIGLESEQGERRILIKQTNNVVSLQRH